MTVLGASRFVAGRLQLVMRNFGDNGEVVVRSHDFDGSEKSITAPRQSLYKSRIVGGVIKSPAKPFHGRIKTVFEVHVSVGGPEFSAKLFARNQLTGTLQKADQNLNRLPLQTDFAALLRQLRRTQVKLEQPKSQRTGSRQRWSHRPPE